MAGKNEAFRICSSVSEALSYMPCPLQYTEPNTQNELWIFWSQYNNDFPTVFPTTAATTIYHDTIKEKIVSALKNAYISDNYGCWLVQFWAPVTTKGQIFLTTCDLPFGLTKLHEGLCYYRSECLKVRTPIVTDSSENEYRLGPTGRVFKHGLPEMSPDVSRYSVADFPLHGSALTAGLGNYLAVPVFEPLSNECAGVLEIIGDKKGSFSQDLVQMVYEMLKKVELRSSNMYGHPEKKGLRGLERALKEIKDQLNFLCITHQLPLAQTWLPILDGSNVERFTTAEEQFCICTSAGYEFRAACDMFHLGKSQGVVGRAFLSHSSCFCSDITELRMSEYPLAHVAHRVGLHSSFAICLQSYYTGDYVYLLEFFLPQDNKSDCRSPQTMLNMLLASMKRQFRSFKLSSGQKLGEKLSVEIIPVPSDDGLNSFEICHSVKPLSDIEAVARPGKIEWFDPLGGFLWARKILGDSESVAQIHADDVDYSTRKSAATTIYHDTIKEKIVSALKNAYISDNYGCWLVQFWAPVTTKDQIFLTTCDLPFGLTKLHEGLCYYRSECLKVRIPIVTDSSENEYRLGPTGRVFKHGLPEMSPDVSRYSVADFPLHGSALTAGLGNYLAVPVFEPLSNECAGVLEIIGDKKGSFSQDLVQMVYEMLKKVELRSSNMYGHPEKKGLRGLECALKEIEEQLNFICRTHQLPLAQTWLPILDGSNVERFKTTAEQFCICTSAGYEFRAACDMFHLGKSQGVVGKAFLTRISCFCSDITQLSMTEYPLAHVAHRVGLHSSFAICLQSSYTGDYVYLLEFFLPQDNKSDCRSPQTILNMLLASMKRQFRSFKLASGQKLGEKLSVEVIPVPSDDGLESFDICHSGKTISDIEAVARPEKILWFNPLNRLLKSGNTVNLFPENVDLTTLSRTANTTTNLTKNVTLQTNRSVEEESMMKISERQYRINSTVLQQSAGAKIYGSETTLASQSSRNRLGTEHLEVNDVNCSSDQLEFDKGADIYFKETSGGDQFCHVTTTSLTHAARPNTQATGVHEERTIPRKRSDFLNSCFPAGELERSAKVPKLSEYEGQQIISKESGSLLKENFEGGATWAYEVGSQSMVCPIIVEDLNRPRQMRVEMICEEPVLFVEIANIIIGIGLTILKWAMETRNDKTWAGFIVEANRDVTRMEIFISLVHLLGHIAKLEENLQMSLSMT